MPDFRRLSEDVLFPDAVFNPYKIRLRYDIASEFLFSGL